MSNSIRCPKCGNETPSLSPGGVCPKCLLAAGLDAESFPPTMDSPRSGEAFVAPIPSELASKFPDLEILELLGKGGMGAVYKARQKGLERLVALKILPPEVGRDPAFAERFRREGKALAQLNHPNVVAVYQSGNIDGLFYFVMEYVDGLNLRQAIKSGEMSPDAALAIVPQICDALQYAHDEGVVHRDIKPENILLDKRGRVKIADFGLAKLLDHETNAALTQTHQVMGTLRYMAPEQMEGTHTVDHRADIYSLGVVFYELLTGELPIGRFAPPSKKVQVDVRLDEVVLRALAKEPELRYQQVSEVRTDVDAIYRDLPPSIQMALGREYKSKATLFGWPLVHIATGIDPRTGRKRVAKGVIAIGDIAIGGLALGGASMGLISMGGASIGLVSLGGASIGLLLAIGGCAIGLGLSFGGLAVGSVALGGMAIGYYAFGGGALGVHTMSGAGVDPEARKLFEPWAMNWTQWVTAMSIAFPILWFVIYGIIWLIFRFQTENADQRGDQGPAAANQGRTRPSGSSFRPVAKTAAAAQSNPYLPTNFPHVAPHRKSYVAPGVLLLLLAVAQLVVTLGASGTAAISLMAHEGERPVEQFDSTTTTMLIFPLLTLGAWCLVSSLQSLAMLLGAVSLFRGEPGGFWPKAAGFVAVIPCSIMWLATLPVGIWVLVIAYRRPDDHAAPSRPLLVPVLATFNLVGALLLMLITSADDITPYADRFWVVWEQVDMIVSFLMAAALFLGSIGLFLWQPWARKLIVATSIAGIVSFVVDIPYLTRAVIPHWSAELQAEMKDELRSDDPIGGMIDEMDLEAQTFFILFALIGSVVAIWLVWMIGQLVYFTRPHVIAAFEGTSGNGQFPPLPESGSDDRAAPTMREMGDNVLRQYWPRWLVRALTTLVYLTCLILFFSFRGGQYKADDGGKAAWMKVGNPSPWMEVEATKTSHSIKFHLISWSALSAATGIGALALYRYTEILERGRAHSMAWHYGSWGVMMAVVATIALMSIYLTQNPPTMASRACQGLMSPTAIATSAL